MKLTEEPCCFLSSDFLSPDLRFVDVHQEFLNILSIKLQIFFYLHLQFGLFQTSRVNPSHQLTAYTLSHTHTVHTHTKAKVSAG